MQRNEFLTSKDSAAPTLFLANSLARDRCYDVLHIFAKKLQKIGLFDSKQSQMVQKCHHNIGF
jgi:hypothetical protein